MKLDNFKVYVGPLSNKLYLAKIGKTGSTLAKEDRTNEFINVFRDFLEKSGDQVLSKDGKPEWEIRLIKV